jgi:hypothetical protein
MMLDDPESASVKSESLFKTPQEYINNNNVLLNEKQNARVPLV